MRLSSSVHAVETWTIKINDSRKRLAFEIRCHRRLFKVRWKDKVGDEIVIEKAERHCVKVDSINQMKMKLTGHMCRMKDTRLVKAVMLRMVEVINLVEDAMT